MFLPKLKLSSSIVLPTVYSDSLSYGEELNKIKWYINKIIEGTNIDPNNIEYRGVITTFGGTLTEGVYSVITNDASEHFPTGFSGKGTLMIIKGAQNTAQATLFAETGNVYTRVYYFDTGHWDSAWSTDARTKLLYQGTIYNFSDVPAETMGVWSVRNENATGFPNDDAGTWTFGTLIVVQNMAYWMATLTASNGHCYTRFYNSHTSEWSDWRSDYGNIVDLTDEFISSAVTLGEHDYLRYRQMGYEVFLDADLDSVAAPTDETPIYVNVDSHIPHNTNRAIQVPFIAGGGHIIGTCRVGVTGQLSVERAYDLDTNTKITSGYIRWLHIHACYNIKS